MTILGYAQGPFRYVSPDFKAIASNHKVLAILPFDVSLSFRPGVMKSIDPEELRKLEIEEGKMIQNSAESYLLMQKSQKGFGVSFQNTVTTNAILLQNEVTPFNIAKFSRAQLAQMLGVDGIVYGSVNSTQLMSDGFSLLMSMSGYYSPPTNAGGMVIYVADAVDGKIIWRYETFHEGWLGSSQQSVVNRLLKRAGRRFPYKRLP